MRVRRPKPKRRTELGLLIFGALIVVAAYVLTTVGTTSKIPANLGAFLGVVLGLGLAAHIANRIYAPDATAVLLPIAVLLNGLGYVMLARIAHHWAQAQAGWTAAGVGAYILTLAIVRRSRDLDRYRYLLLLAAVALMLSPSSPTSARTGAGRVCGWASGRSTASPSSSPSWRCASSSPPTSSRGASSCRCRRCESGTV